MEAFWPSDLFTFKRQCIYSSSKGYKVLNKVCERGTIYQWKANERGTVEVTNAIIDHKCNKTCSQM